MSSIYTEKFETLQIWELCRGTFARYGCNLKFPKNTPKEKTYHWRFASRLNEKFKEWEFDAPAREACIEIAAQTAGPKRLRQSGLAALFRDDLLQVCYSELTKQHTDALVAIDNIRESHNFVTSMCAGRELLSVLSLTSPGQYNTNLVVWYERGRICPEYVAMSKACYEALKRLSIAEPSQRSIVLPDSRIDYLRSRLLKNDNFNLAVQEILAADWRR